MTSTTAYDRIVEALRDAVPTVRANGTSATANCPAHDDKNPSLGVTRIEGSVLINCRSQHCDPDTILAALHLTRRDLYDEPSGATYTYTDLNGTPTRRVHRTPDKKFRQTGNTRGTAQLYRLPRVVAAVAAGTPIYLVEGEKDVHALETLGAIATTSPMGATNWGRVDPTPLTGAHVIIVPDRDEAGMKYATAATTTLNTIAATIEIHLPKTGKDAADHVAAGHTLQDLQPTTLPDHDEPTDPNPEHRRVLLTPASAIKPRRVRWLWKDRIAYGTLALLAGREGLGKSTLGYSIAADITRGTLEGEDHGTPRSVLVCATEDSWEHTIVPRLIAAGADLDKVYRVEIVTHDNMHLSISLPRDFTDVEYAASETDAGLMILDPLMSVIDSRLDTHRDREVRQALEPLAALADRARMAIIGLIHHNKSGSTDALQLVMGSKAFAAVARSVHTCIPDPDDETQTRRLFATSKNNLGRLDLPVLGFTITSHAVETEDDGTAWTGRLKWTGEVEGSMHELMTRSADPERTATSEAADWLLDYLASKGGEAAKTDVEKAGRVAGHSVTAIRRARERLRLEYRSWGFPRQTLWSLPRTTTTETGPNPSHATYSPDDADTASHATVASLFDTTDTTGSDQAKQSDDPETPRARVHAGGDDMTDTTGNMTRLESHHSDSRASRASRAGSPRAHARETPHEAAASDDPKPPLCPDCGWPVDSNGHDTNCLNLRSGAR